MRAPVRLKYITYGGGELEMSEFAWGTANLSLPTPAREGFDFRGWYLSNRYKQAFDAAAPLTADTALYAMWEKAADAVYTGVDVSSYQKEIDWARVKADGVDFARRIGGALRGLLRARGGRRLRGDGLLQLQYAQRRSGRAAGRARHTHLAGTVEPRAVLCGRL